MPRRTSSGRGFAARLGALAATLALVLAGCSVVHDAGTWGDPHQAFPNSGANGAASVPAGPAANGAGASAGAAGTGAAQAPLPAPYDVSALLKPSRKYLGLEIANAPASIAPAEQFAGWTGTKPNLIGQYVAWGTSFDPAAAQNAWSYGAMEFVVWEPWNTTLAQIASGASDTYISNFATAVRALNVPITLSFGHEFNGNWYPWGTTGTSASDFVAAWKHIHDLFATAGATNVIWIWDPNEISAQPDVKLKPYYPGDAYVDWIGVTGYWYQTGPLTYGTLYLPTLEQIRGFTQKPFLIAETSVEPGSNQSASLAALFQAVEQHPDILGFVWYDFNKGGDWRIENRASLLSQFKQDAASGGFGFDVRGLR